MSKKVWNKPEISCLSAQETKDSETLGPIVGGRCTVCNKFFVTAEDYEAHKVMDSFNGKDIGTECPEAPKGDGKLDASFVVAFS